MKTKLVTSYLAKKKIFNMGAGGEEVKIETKAFEKKEKSSAKKALLVTMEPQDR